MRGQIFFALVVASITLLVSAASSQPSTVVEWTFDDSSSAYEWRGDDAIADLAVKDGCLTGRTIGRDPALTGPLVEFAASPYQYVEIRMKSGNGSGELFWTNTTAQPYEGFRGEWYRTISYRSGDFRLYRIFPFWQSLGKIIRLRLDPPEDSEFAVDYIHVVQMNVQSSESGLFDFTRCPPYWYDADGPKQCSTGNGIRLTGQDSVLVLSPRVSLEADECRWLTVMARTPNVAALTLQWVTDELDGIQSYTVSLKTDGKWHAYNLPTDDILEWAGRITVFGIAVQPGDGWVDVRFAGTAERPMGPPDVEIRRPGFKQAINRINSSVTLQAEIANVGGETLRDVRVTLAGFTGAGIPDAPSGSSHVQSKLDSHLRKPWVIGDPVRTIDVLLPGEAKVVSWETCSLKTGDWQATILVSAPGGLRTEAKATVHWYPAVKAARAKYVPEPKPVRGEFEVGMYYFPGWATAQQWSVLDDYPERRPVLGYYREGDPEVADWHIKWMVEHGITFIVYDWYWLAGSRHYEHAIHNGLFNAKYRDRIKFCLLWANHNPPKTSSLEDMEKVTKFWLDNYFLLPQYFKIDGKPVVVIFSTARLTEDMGSEGVRRAFERSRELARERGLPGVYFIACTYPSGPEHMRRLQDEGYDALTGYNYPGAGDKGQLRAPYSDMVEGYQEFWNAIADAATLPYIPVTEPGWDSRPWHGTNARVRTGKTPALFEKMLRNARAFVEKRTPDAHPKIVLVEAWNEFGEGDYTEPHQEWGFAHVDAIRRVFTDAPADHDDITPADVGLGPYDVKPVPLRTSWEFETSSDPGWGAWQGARDSSVQNGCLIASSATHDLAFYSSPVDLDTDQWTACEIRMKTTSGNQAQLFWKGKSSQFSEPASIRFDLISDGEFHVYTLDLGSCQRWKGRVKALRFDPTDTPGAHVELDYIRFLDGAGRQQ